MNSTTCLVQANICRARMNQNMPTQNTNYLHQRPTVNRDGHKLSNTQETIDPQTQKCNMDTS